MIGWVLVILIILALIAAIWGRDTAKGCAANLVTTFLILVATVVIFAVVGSFGITSEMITTGFKYGFGALVVLFVVQLVSARVDAAKDLAAAEHKNEERVQRQAVRQQKKQEVDDRAQVALRKEKERRETVPARLRSALYEANIRKAYEVCVEFGYDWNLVAVQWRDDFTGDNKLTYWMRAYPPSEQDVAGKESQFLIYSTRELDQSLRTVFSLLENTIFGEGNDDDKVICALIAMSGLSSGGGSGRPARDDGTHTDGEHSQPVRDHATRLLDGVVWDLTAARVKRVAALISLGMFGPEFPVNQPITKDTEIKEPLADFLGDGDSEVRAATVFALGLRLQELTSPIHQDATDDPDVTENVKQANEEAVLAQIGLGKMYGRVAIPILLPLLCDPIELVRCEAVRALAGVEDRIVRTQLRERATDPTETDSVRRFATGALQRSGVSLPLASHDPRNDLDPLDAALHYLDEYRNRQDEG